MKPYTPEPEWTQEVVSKDSDPLDTVAYMEAIAREYSWQVSDLAYTLRGETTYETCENIWYWIRENVQYINEKGEELRTPARTIAEAQGDCDCMSILTSALLIENGIDHAFRLASYRRSTPEEYEHVYVVAQDGQDNELVIDCVPEIDNFNEEHTPLINYHDHPMSTTVLRGLGRIGNIVNVDIVPRPDQNAKQYGENFLDGFLTFIRQQLDSKEANEAVMKEYEILNMIETAKNDGLKLGRAMAYAMQNSALAPAYIEANTVLEATLPTNGTVGSLGFVFNSKMIDSVGNAFSKVATGVDLIGGGQRRRANEQNDANQRLAEQSVLVERERTAQAKAMAEAEALKAQAQMQTSALQTQKSADKSEEEKKGFGEVLKQYWWAFAIGLVGIFVAIYFLMAGKRKEVRGVRRRKSTVRGVGKVSKAPARKRRRTVGKARATTRRFAPAPKRKTTTKRKTAKAKGRKRK